MPCPGSGPCGPWDIDLRCCLDVTGGINGDPCLNSGEPVPQAVLDSSILAASQFMWAATGRQFGCCQVQIRPTQDPQDCDCGNDDFGWGFPWIPMHLPDGSWTNISCFCGQDPCGCPPEPCQIALPYPVCSVDEVKVDGIVLGPSLYRVDDFKTLVRMGGVPVRTELTGLNTVATGDHSMPTITVNQDAQFPNNNNNFSAPGQPPCGVLLPTEGTAYTVQWSTNGSALRKDVFVEMCVPLGLPHTFTIGAGANATIEADNIIGASISIVGNTVTVSADPFQANAPRCFRIRIVSPSNFQAVTITPVSTDGNGVSVCAVQWSDPIPGERCFPKCNNLFLPDTEEGTMSVTLTYGRPIPELVRLATAKFACELIKACLDLPCMFPQRVTSISRQGVTVGFLDPMDFVQQGRTGIYLVDMAIKTYNPKGLLKNASVTSKDYMDKWKVTTWTLGDPFGPNCT